MSEPQPNKEVAKTGDAKDVQPTGRAVKLPTWERWLSGALGTALGGAGVWAIIMSGKDGAGSVALIVAAIIFWIIGFIGVIPYKLWGKDMGYELGEIEGARKVAAAVADEVGPEKMQEIVNATVEAPVIERRVGARALNDVVKAGLVAAQQDVEAFADACDAVLERAVALLDESLGPISIEPVFADVDFYDRRIATGFGRILVAYKRRVGQLSLGRLTDEFRARANMTDRFLVITQEPTDPSIVQMWRGSNPAVDVIRLSAAPRLLPMWLEETVSAMRTETQARSRAETNG